MFSLLNFRTRTFFTVIGYILSAVIHTIFLGGILFFLYYSSDFLRVDSRASKMWVSLCFDSSLKSNDSNSHSSGSLTKRFKKVSSESLVKHEKNEENPENKEENPLKKESYDPGQKMLSPKLRNSFVAFYPKRAEEEEIEGDVLLVLHLNQTGKVISAVVKKSSGWKILDEAALKHAKELDFMPCTQNGIAVEAEIEFPFAFRLKNDQSDV